MEQKSAKVLSYRVLRVAYGASNPQVVRKLNELHRLKVFHAPKLVVRLSLKQGQLGHAIQGIPSWPEAAYKVILQEPGAVHFYLRMLDSPSVRGALSEEICSFCGIADGKWPSIINKILIHDDEKKIHDILRRADVDGHEEHEYVPMPLETNIERSREQKERPALMAVNNNTKVETKRKLQPEKAPEIKLPFTPLEGAFFSEGTGPSLSERAKILEEKASNLTIEAEKLVAFAPIWSKIALTPGCLPSSIKNAANNPGNTPASAALSNEIQVSEKAVPQEASATAKEKQSKRTDTQRLQFQTFTAGGAISQAEPPTVPQRNTSRSRGTITYGGQSPPVEHRASPHQIAATTAVPYFSQRSRNRSSGATRDRSCSSDRSSSPEKSDARLPVGQHTPRTDLMAFSRLSPPKSGSRRAGSPCRTNAIKSEREQLREQLIGLSGEKYVYELLKRILGDEEFPGESVWTSELRGMAGDEFSTWIPDDPYATYADFTISDPRHVLRAWLTSAQHNESVEIFGDLPPAASGNGVLETFHIEVKSTGGNILDAFHLSRAQMDMATKMSQCGSAGGGGGVNGNGNGNGNGTGPRDVFAIFRVAGVMNRRPCVRIYLDPCKLVEKRMLGFYAESFLMMQL